MKILILQNGEILTSLAESIGNEGGVAFSRGSDFIRITWDEAIKVRDWLQMAIAERTERLVKQSGRSGGR